MMIEINDLIFILLVAWITFKILCRMFDKPHDGKFRLYDQNGSPLTGGKVSFFDSNGRNMKDLSINKDGTIDGCNGLGDATPYGSSAIAVYNNTTDMVYQWDITPENTNS